MNGARKMSPTTEHVTARGQKEKRFCLWRGGSTVLLHFKWRRDSRIPPHGKKGISHLCREEFLLLCLPRDLSHLSCCRCASLKDHGKRKVPSDFAPKCLLRPKWSIATVADRTIYLVAVVYQSGASPARIIGEYYDPCHVRTCGLGACF